MIYSKRSTVERPAISLCPLLWLPFFNHLVGQPDLSNHSRAPQSNEKRPSSPVHPQNSAMQLSEQSVRNFDPITNLKRFHWLDFPSIAPNPIRKFQIFSDQLITPRLIAQNTNDISNCYQLIMAHLSFIRIYEDIPGKQ